MKLGVLGTFVWDTIWTRDDVRAGRPFTTWGGLAYSLAAAAAARTEAIEIVPIAKVGRDLADEARAFVDALPGIRAGDGILPVDAPNNRVELRYTDDARRGERLTGGVPAWTWDELAPRVAGLDALYVNFFSGFEMGLETAERLRASFRGPVYCDLHSLFLGCPGKGERARRRLRDWERWAACFDAVQLNGDELGEVGGAGEAMEDRCARLLAQGPGLVLVTLGAEGAASGRRAGFADDPRAWPAARAASADAIDFVRHPLPRACPGDPTGAGDVWGITCFASLAAGVPLAEAVARAHALAGRKLSHRGASGLYAHLRDG